MKAPALPRVPPRALRLLSYAVLAALLGATLLVATATVPVLFGYHTYVVNGGSMEPSLKAGSVAVAKPTSPFDLEIGDIIAQRASESSPPVLHRIVAISDDNGKRLIVTRGDANHAADPEPIVLQGPGDKVVYSVPYAGYILNFARGALGRILLMGVPLALLAAIILYDKLPLRRLRRTDNPRPAQLSLQAADLGPSPAGWQQAPSVGQADGPLLAPTSWQQTPATPPEPAFHPDTTPITIVLAAVPGFRDLIVVERALEELACAAGVSIAAFKGGTALLKLNLRSPLAAHAIVDELRRATACQFLVEEARPDLLRLRLRFVSTLDGHQVAQAA